MNRNAATLFCVAAIAVIAIVLVQSKETARGQVPVPVPPAGEAYAPSLVFYGQSVIDTSRIVAATENVPARDEDKEVHIWLETRAGVTLHEIVLRGEQAKNFARYVFDAKRIPQAPASK